MLDKLDFGSVCPLMDLAALHFDFPSSYAQLTENKMAFPLKEKSA